MPFCVHDCPPAPTATAPVPAAWLVSAIVKPPAAYVDAQWSTSWTYQLAWL